MSAFIAAAFAQNDAAAARQQWRLVADQILGEFREQAQSIFG